MGTGSIPIRASASRISLVDDGGTLPGGSDGSHEPVPRGVGATDEGLQLLRELQDNNAHLQRELMGAGYAIDRLVLTVRIGGRGGAAEERGAARLRGHLQQGALGCACLDAYLRCACRGR
jgi:hypothetical protein